jgi:adhesin transport system outer membrane protein
MVLAREDLILVDAEYLAALSTILPRFDLTFAAGELFAGRRIIESRNPEPVILPTELPQVTFGPFRDAETNNYSSPDFSLAITGRQLIFDGGRWWSVLERVSELRTQQTAALRGVENQVRASVARTFYGLEKARRAIETVREQLEFDRAQIERARLLYEAGRGRRADTATAERNLAADEVTLQEFLLAEAQARRAFNLQLGRDPQIPALLVVSSTITSITRELPARSVPDTEALLTIALDQRPELTNMRAQVRARQEEVDIAVADYWPVIGLETNYQRSSRRPDRVFNNPFENYIATVQLAISWNLFQGLATKAAVEQALVAMRRQLEELERLEREVRADVEDRRQELLRQRAVYALARRQISAAEEAVGLARGLFAAGRGTALELRDAELGLTQARLTAINARLDVEIAFADLVRAVGTSEWLSEARSPKN